MVKHLKMCEIALHLFFQSVSIHGVYKEGEESSEIRKNTSVEGHFLYKILNKIN